MSQTSTESRWYRRAGVLPLAGGIPVLAQAVVPIQEFVPRGDDAFHYFKLAVNFPAHGFWTFDGIHPTNGVQPLWAVLLTVVAQLAFALLNSAISILLYPIEIYSTLSWWLAETEIVLVTLAATAAALGFLVHRRVERSRALRLVTVGLATLTAAHATTSLLFYFDGAKQTRPWNQSWNDESYRAAGWINANLPPGTLIGSWNAGVLGYYAERPVVSLDGLINGFDLVPFLREGRIADYIRREGIQYLSDLDPKFQQMRIAEQLPLTEVYRHYTAWGEPYRIYRVLEGSAP